jgi:hypothetical protein
MFVGRSRRSLDALARFPRRSPPDWRYAGVRHRRLDPGFDASRGGAPVSCHAARRNVSVWTFDDQVCPEARAIGHLTRRNARCQCSIMAGHDRAMTGHIRLAAPNVQVTQLRAKYACSCYGTRGRRMYRVESIYPSSEQPRLQVASESDLLAALAAQLLKGDHFLDLKREVAAGTAQNRLRTGSEQGDGPRLRQVRC